MKTTLLLIQAFGQATFTITEGEAPVLPLDSNFRGAIPAVVNFLRSGCPVVQMYAQMALDHFDYGSTPEMIEKALKQLELEEEEFRVKADYPVISITRHARVRDE